MPGPVAARGDQVLGTDPRPDVFLPPGVVSMAYTDPRLQAEFGDLVPVVRVDGKELGYWRIDEAKLRKALG